jgi:uncharacterized protein DUF4019
VVRSEWLPHSTYRETDLSDTRVAQPKKEPHSEEARESLSHPRAGGRGAPRSTRARLTGSIDINILFSFVFGVVFLAIMLGFATWYPNPTPFQIKVFVTALSAAAAGVGAVIPGILNVRIKVVVRAGGALALFVIVWFSQPVLEQTVVTLQAPTESPTPVIDQFLSDLDKHDVAKAYADLDPLSRETMVPTLALWQQLYDANIKNLGQLESRKLMGVNSATSPSGAPVGIYQSNSYLGKYSNISGCRPEAVTVRATQDKQWRVYSYVIASSSIDCPP